MRSLLRRCFRHHGTAAAYVALVLALGGTAYAAAYITGADIVDGSVTSADFGAGQVTESTLATDAVSARTLRTNSVYSGNIADGMIIGKDISEGALTSREVADNSLTGKDLKIDIVTAEASTEVNNTEAHKYVRATCPAGYAVISGGGRVVDPIDYSDAVVDIRGSEPDVFYPGSPPRAWEFWAGGSRNNTGWGLHAYAVCAAL